MSHPLEGMCGEIYTKRETLIVQILSVSEKKCPHCGGPWGEIIALNNAVVNEGALVLIGTTLESCLNDVHVKGTGKN